MRPLRIAQFTASHGQGGLERHVEDLVNALAARGHTVMFAGHPDWQDRFDPAVQFRPINTAASRWNLPALLALRRAVTAFRPDVVHVHAHKAAAMARHALRGLPAVTVATVHGFKKNNRMLAGFDRCIAVSGGVAAHVGLDNVRVVYNGMQAVVPATVPDLCREFDLPPGRPVLLAVGRLAPVKGYDVLLTAWRRLADRASLVIAGDGPEHAALAGLVEQYGLGDAVRLAGFRDDIPALLAACDALVIASHREGFPYAMVEALLARRAVLSTRVPGALEWLPAECCAAVGDPDDLAAMLVRNLDDREALHARFVPVWQRAQDELSLAGMVDRVEQVYREVVGD